MIWTVSHTFVSTMFCPGIAAIHLSTVLYLISLFVCLFVYSLVATLSLFINSIFMITNRL
jgi:hypothetical protein